MAALLKSRREMVVGAIERADDLAKAMASRSMEFVLCHCDLHPGNLLIDLGGAVFIIDWDYPMLAPKERDLMFIGGGQGFKPYVADITVESERILSSKLSAADRAQSLQYLGFYFLPGCTLEVARKWDLGRRVL
jgi:hypothetical protein